MFNLSFAINILLIISFVKLYSNLILETIYNDSPEPWGIGFQDGVSPGYTGIVELHDNIFFYLVVIAILVFWMLGSTIYYFNYDKTKITHKYLVHGTLIEILWTIFPAIVLLAIAIPSFRLLYILDEVTLPTITVKVTGHQWYWSYEYSDYETESGDPIEFDSYMIPDSDLEIGQTRLLEVDNPIILPENTHVRFIVTSTDVLHDFAIPAAGIKIDATPGRLNQSSFFSEREGELFGQCSELCGTYHGFMPIQVEVGSVEDYLSWISSLSLLTIFSNKKTFKNNSKISNPFFSFKYEIKSKINLFNFTASRTASSGRPAERQFNSSKESFWVKLVVFTDFIIFGLVVSFLIYDLLVILSSWFDSYQNLSTDFICNVGDNNSGQSSAHNTTVIHNDNGWSNSIRQIFIYGSGALRLQLLRGGGTPMSRTFVIASTVAADATSKVLVNAINDPEYVEKHINSWTRILGKNNSSVHISVDNDSETLEKVNVVTTKFTSNGLENWSDNLLNYVIDILKPILEPVTVDYSNELLATQIYGISIMLFVLSVLIIILLIALFINILIWLYSDKLMSYFSNKYIRWYINLNKKIIGIEVCFLGISILYFMYILSYGIHFIATHPITIS